MRIGFLFAGQGSQYVGMGKDLYEEYEEVKNIYDQVNEITGIDIKKLSFEGPEEKLNRTKYTQLAVLTNSLGILEVLKKNGIKAEISSGLSLGEYTALIYSGLIDLYDGVKIVKARGEFMENLLPNGDWLMAAILGLEDDQVEKVCSDVKSGFVRPANYNCRGQIVISGEKNAVIEAVELAKSLGARASILNTSGPFHTEMLKKSKEALEKELENFNFNRFNTKVIKNIDGDFYNDEDDIKKILANHIINPVKFSKGLEKMLDEGIDIFIEVGPGKTLSSLIKKTALKRGIKVDVLNANSVESILQVINFIKEKKENE